MIISLIFYACVFFNPQETEREQKTTLFCLPAVHTSLLLLICINQMMPQTQEQVIGLIGVSQSGRCFAIGSRLVHRLSTLPHLARNLTLEDHCPIPQPGVQVFFPAPSTSTHLAPLSSWHSSLLLVPMLTGTMHPDVG